MALKHLIASSTLTFPPPFPLPKKPIITIFSQTPSRLHHHHQPKKRRHKWSAVADEISAAASVIREEEEEAAVVKYEWSEEWYPLYLTENVPHDAPLGLTVFDKQVVLFRDGGTIIRCYEDRCPHRLAKLSEGQLFDGRLECLYHGWQFEGNGKCAKIPQLTQGAKIPSSACAKPYEIKDSQGVIWIWMSHKTPPNPDKIPWFDNFERPGFRVLSTIHELPYDHSVLLENLMDPAHVPISHDRVDSNAKREEAGPLYFHVTERTERGFAGRWGREMDLSNPNHAPNFLRFEAPCILQSNREMIDKNGEKVYNTGLFLCRPSGQGKSMAIIRFGNTRKPSILLKLIPQWFLHQIASKILEQDMGFLSSQNEILMKEKVPTGKLYINLRSSDTWVCEYRKWMDKVGHGMPYHFGHTTVSLPQNPAVVEQSPAGFAANVAASQPAKGGVGTMHVPNLVNRYFRHVVHCKECMSVLRWCSVWRKAFFAAAVVSTATAILVCGRQWKVVFLLSTGVFLVGVQICSSVIGLSTTNFMRRHRR